MTTYDLPVGDPRVQAVAVAIEPYLVGNAERVAVEAIAALRKYLEGVVPVKHYKFSLLAPGDKKIQCIKEVRSITNLGLKEAKDIVEGYFPVVLRDDLTYDQARNAEALFDYIGAKVRFQET